MLLPKRLGEKGLRFRYRIDIVDELTREQVDKEIKDIIYSLYILFPCQLVNSSTIF